MTQICKTETRYAAIAIDEFQQITQYSERNKGYRLPLSKQDLELWLNETSPVIIVMYDAFIDSGYFVELHGYFQKNRLRNV